MNISDRCMVSDVRNSKLKYYYVHIKTVWKITLLNLQRIYDLMDV